MAKLGRKQSSTNEAWVTAMANAKEAVSLTDIKALAKATVLDIKTKVKGLRVAFAWSGGKDSIVLAALCKKAGVAASMMGMCNLEYAAFMEWVEANKPEGCEIINTGQGLEWLAKNQDMLFPDSKKAARWFSIVQHRAQTAYCKANDIEILLVGRRRADGNFVGKGTNVYTNGKGVTYFSPLADWTHEQLLAYIAHFDLPMPPIYGWANGYKCGTHPWPARQYVGDTQNGWREVYDIEPQRVIDAAEHIESARTFLEGVGV